MVPAFKKIMESAFKLQIGTYFETNQVLYPQLYGFRLLCHLFLNASKANAVTSAVLCDLSKALDCVGDAIMSENMSYYGAIPWRRIHSFSSNPILRIGSKLFSISGCLRRRFVPAPE